MDETSVGPLKSAGVEVEPSKVRFKIDVNPLTAGGFGVLGGLPHELTTDPAVLVAAAGLGVHQEPVIPSVPRDVDESDQQPIPVPGTDPAETPSADPAPPPDARSASVGFDEVDHLVVGHRLPPGVRNLFATLPLWRAQAMSVARGPATGAIVTANRRGA